VLLDHGAETVGAREGGGKVRGGEEEERDERGRKRKKEKPEQSQNRAGAPRPVRPQTAEPTAELKRKSFAPEGDRDA
jgi:hypothetical protein